MLHLITKSLIRLGDLLKLTARVENNNHIHIEVANWFDLVYLRKYHSAVVV